jgi:TPR repeat protein
VEAVKWYRKAAEQNVAEAQYNLGVCYDKGQGVAKDLVEAVKWWRKAAEQNHAEAQFNLGSCYAKGQGVAKNEVAAVRWYHKAAEQNIAQAQHDLGVCYAFGHGVAKDYSEAVRWWCKAAEQNDADAQYNLGTCYATGQGVAEDVLEAVKWWRKAAEQNHAEAQYNLGICYATGRGVAKDEVEAVLWYSKAAEQNYADAQYNLSACYARGEGVTKDYVEAYKWVLVAAAQGFEPAKKKMTELERRLTREQVAEGQKRAGDFKPLQISSLNAQQHERYSKELAELLAKAETGDAKAQNELGEAFFAGKLGVAKDCAAAVRWFRKAADQNHPAAQSNLGDCYERGDGVAKYEVEAYKWDLLAAAQGDTKAKRNASLLELLLSQEQIAEGKRRAQDWLEQRKKAPTNN